MSLCGILVFTYRSPCENSLVYYSIYTPLCFNYRVPPPASRKRSSRMKAETMCFRTLNVTNETLFLNSVLLHVTVKHVATTTFGFETRNWLHDNRLDQSTHSSELICGQTIHYVFCGWYYGEDRAGS